MQTPFGEARILDVVQKFLRISTSKLKAEVTLDMHHSTELSLNLLIHPFFLNFHGN